MIANTIGNCKKTKRQTAGMSYKQLARKNCFPRFDFLLSSPCSLLLCLLVAFFSFSSCSGIFDNLQLQTLPENCGSFTLNLDGRNDDNNASNLSKMARTILPGSPVLSDFAVINLNFEPDSSVVGNTAVLLNVDKNNYGVANGQTFILVAGTYNLTVRAYLDAAKTSLVAQSAAENILISAGQNTSRSITLTPLLSSTTEKGSFLWNITLSTSTVIVETATMTIKNSGGVTQGAVVDLLQANLNGTRTGLTPGMYTVTFNIEGKEGTNILRSIVWNELMYVYGNLDGNFTKTFTDDDFHRTQWNITFDYDNGETYEAPGTPNFTNVIVIQSVIHGDNINTLPTSRPGYLFGGWFTEPACTNEWNLADPIHNDMTLYAKWTANTAVITLSVEAIIDGTKDENFAPISISRGAVPASVTSTVTVTGTTYSSSVTWTIDNVGTYTGETSGTGNSFTLNGADTKYNTLGGHVLELTVTVNGNKYQMNIPFTVVN